MTAKDGKGERRREKRAGSAIVPGREVFGSGLSRKKKVGGAGKLTCLPLRRVDGSERIERRHTGRRGGRESCRSEEEESRGTRRACELSC